MYKLYCDHVYPQLCYSEFFGTFQKVFVLFHNSRVSPSCAMYIKIGVSFHSKEGDEGASRDLPKSDYTFFITHSIPIESKLGVGQ